MPKKGTTVEHALSVTLGEVSWLGVGVFWNTDVSEIGVVVILAGAKKLFGAHYQRTETTVP